MSNTSRRAISSRTHTGERECNSKSILVEFLNYEGAVLEFGPVTNKGDWNERRVSYAVRGDERFELDHHQKGCRKNWQCMWNEFKRQAGVTT